jgi:signal transduction histidine kinase
VEEAVTGGVLEAQGASRLAGRLLTRRAGLLSAFTALLVALVVTFAYVGVHFQNDSRHQAQERFAAQGTLAAQFSATVIQSSVASGTESATKLFAGPTVSPAALAATVRSAHAAYLVVLDAHGERIAASPGTPKGAAAVGSPQVRHALAGHAWFSSLIPAAGGKGDLVEVSLPYDTPSGRRIAVEGASASTLGSFFRAFLANIESGGGGTAFLVDEHSRVVAASSRTATIGARPASELVAAVGGASSGEYDAGGARRYFTAVPVGGSSWRVLLTTRTSDLYPALAGTESWIFYVILGAFAAAGLTTVLFFRRALVAGEALRRSNGELLAVNATLEERVAERTAAAEERATELARSNEELEQFSSVASHDLQEPLRKIRMFGDRLRATLGDDLAAEPAADLERMRSAAERMQRLINDLLDFSRVTHRGNAFEPVDLGAVASGVVADLEARIVELDARVEVGELPTVQADRTQMRQLLQNLIGNALKFHRAGEQPVVRVQAKLFTGRVPRFPSESVVGDRCVLTVEDNGIGFDEKHAERIFGAFERLHGRSAYDGTGIGLSIARKIVWRHGGTIVAHGVPNVGATFTVTLPLSQPIARRGGPPE